MAKTKPGPTRARRLAGQPVHGRVEKSAARRAAILSAALDEFSARGFAAARLEDIAKRAGVAKGTIYLYFRSKEALFREIVRSLMGPFVGVIEEAFRADVPIRVVAEQVVELFVRDIFHTRRKDVIRLVMMEGPRFPNLAEFYYREVLARIFGAARKRLRRAFDRGELRHDALVRFPQLIAAPGIMAIIWSGLFDRFEPLDVQELLRAQVDILFAEGEAA